MSGGIVVTVVDDRLGSSQFDRLTSMHLPVDVSARVSAGMLHSPCALLSTMRRYMRYTGYFIGIRCTTSLRAVLNTESLEAVFFKSVELKPALITNVHVENK